MCSCRKLVNYGIVFTAPCRKHAPQSDTMIRLWDKKATLFIDAEHIRLFGR